MPKFDVTDYYRNASCKLLLNKTDKARDKIEPIIIEDDDEDEKSPVEIRDLISESDDSDSDDEVEGNTWNKLIKNIDQNQFQMEFESGREVAARKIAKELQESKIDLIGGRL